MSSETRDHKITIHTNNSEICITELSSVRAAAEKFLTITITGNNTQTDNGEINIAGMCTGAAVRTYKAEIDADRNYYVALCEAGVIDIVGNDNRILVVSNGQIINCSGTRNRISITGINAAIKGVKGNRIRLSVSDDGNNLIGDLTGCIGENGLKENVLYRASGQFVEASVVEEAVK